VALSVADNTVFNMTLTGAGTTAAPWVVSTQFAATAVLDDIPDVVITSVANAHVLGWDSATSKWTNRAPTTAASGSVTHDTSLSGDGSGGSPLQVVEDPAGFLVTGASGLGLTVTGKNRLVQHFATSGARTAGLTAPDLNTLTMLDSVPGRIDYYTGTAWTEYGQFTPDFTGEMLPLSGSYVANVGKLRMMIRQINTTTDASGYFNVLTGPQLSTFAGVLGAWFQPTTSTVYSAIMDTSDGVSIKGRAYKLTDGSVHASQGVSGVVFAVIY